MFAKMMIIIGWALAQQLLPQELIAQQPSAKKTMPELQWIDKSILPSENFYGYANGLWLKNHPIPPEYASWGTFSILKIKVEKVIHQMIMETAHQKYQTPGSIEQKVGDFYQSGMDEKTINQQGITPLMSDFQKIDAIKTTRDLPKIIAYLQKMGVNVCFDFGSMQDFQNSDAMIGYAEQGGLTLPDRDYYLKEHPKFQRIREAYLEYMRHLFELLGETKLDAKRHADLVLSIETKLAMASMSRIEMRDPVAIYHMMDLKALDTLTPHFSWGDYLKFLGYPDIKRFNMATPHFFKTMDALLQTISIEDWKTYLRWHLIDDYAPYLSEPFVNEHFKMTSFISGTKVILPRWQRVIRVENQALGFAIGKMYVDNYVPAKSKQEVSEILANIRKTLRQDLKTLPWMSKKTRLAALKKLDLMGVRVGYPDKWWDYSSLKIATGSYVLNVKRANEFLAKRNLDKIGKPVDKSEWAMTPQTVNAYYDPSMNNINIPAGIMQPPFFDVNAPAAFNYGAIGFVIGHEMTHGFDDQGAQFDGQGNLKNWWTPADLKKFKAATACIANQFSSYLVEDSLKIQGPLVVGEAAADLGGLILAYRAFHDSKDYQTAKTIDGFSPDQQFFLSMAHVWATNIRPEELRTMVTIDPHPPAKYRVNGTLANMREFQKAFRVPPKSSMVNSNRCVIW